MSGSAIKSIGRAGVILWTLLAFASALGFYYWTVKSTASELRIHDRQVDYYNLLVDGFQRGVLWMDAEPDPKLLALSPEQRPGGAPFLLDASLYKDRYYLYFGVVPAVLLFWPFTALTGHDLPVTWAALFLATLALLFSWVWWREARRQFFPELSAWWDGLAVIAFGWCSVMPSTLRRPLFYEVAIIGGWMFGAMMLWALLRARRSDRPAKWLVMAGVAAGLAIGSRANLAPVALVALAIGAWLAARATGKGWRRAVQCIALAAAGAAPIGGGLAAYNYARFGSILEFGHTYQLGLVPEQLFRGTNLVHNLRIYYLEPPQLSAYFPFVAPPSEPAKPVDYIGREHAHGEFVWWGAVAVALGAVIWSRRWSAAGRFLIMTSPVLIWFLGNLLVTALTGVRSNRYMLDFHPALVWVTVGLLGLAAAGKPALSRWAGLLGGVAIALALLFNALASMQVHGFFSATDPLAYRRIGERLDAIAAVAIPPLFSNVGAASVEIDWPAEASTAGGRFPLVAAGVGDAIDGIWMDFDGAGRMRFVYQHGEYGQMFGGWAPYSAATKARIKVSGAFLLPPTHHRWYGDRSMAERSKLKKRLRLWLDGDLRFDRDVPSYDVAPWQLSWGRLEMVPGHVYRLPWAVSNPRVEPLDAAWVPAELAAQGTIRAWVEVTDFGIPGLSEPLVLTGQFPHCDLVALRQTRRGYGQIVHDRFGYGGEVSEEFPISFTQPNQLELELPMACDPFVWSDDGQVSTETPRVGRVRWNGKEVLRFQLGMHPAEPQDVTVGANLTASSTARPTFSGNIRIGHRLVRGGTATAGTLELPERIEDNLIGSHGTLITWPQPQSGSAALVWRRDGAGSVHLGWVDEDRVVWGQEPVLPGGGRLRLELPSGRIAGQVEKQQVIEVDQNGRILLQTQTAFFRGSGVLEAWLLDWHWTGAISDAGKMQERSAAVLPGRMRMRISLPQGPASPNQPLITVGRIGRADGIYLRAIGAEKWVVGHDHWGVHSQEGEPFHLSATDSHTVVVELGSLMSPGVTQGVRVWVNGVLVLNAPERRLHPLHSVAEAVWGANPVGMSTSTETFQGKLLSVRTQVEEPR